MTTHTNRKDYIHPLTVKFPRQDPEQTTKFWLFPDGYAYQTKGLRHDKWAELNTGFLETFYEISFDTESNGRNDKSWRPFFFSRGLLAITHQNRNNSLVVEGCKSAFTRITLDFLRRLVAAQSDAISTVTIRAFNVSVSHHEEYFIDVTEKTKPLDRQAAWDAVMEPDARAARGPSVLNDIIKPYMQRPKSLGMPSEAYENILTLIRTSSQRAAPYGNRQLERDLCVRSGFRKDRFGHFLERRPGYDNWTLPIPLGYLEALGITLEILEETLQKDIADYTRARRYHTSIPGTYYIPNVRWCRPTYRIPGDPQTEVQAVRNVINALLETDYSGGDRVVEVNSDCYTFRIYWITLQERTETGGQFRITRIGYEPSYKIDKKRNTVYRCLSITNRTAIEAHFTKPVS